MGRKGFTLVEALVAMMILALIGGAMMAFFALSAKLFRRGVAESQAESAASRTIKKMGPIVHEALDLNVVVRDGNTGEVRVELSLPLKQTDPVTGEDLVALPMTVDKEVAFYRSDESGDPDETGEHFWRAEKVGGNWQPVERLAAGLTSFTAPTVDTMSPKGLEVVVTAAGTSGSRTATVTHREYVMCRNSQ